MRVEQLIIREMELGKLSLMTKGSALLRGMAILNVRSLTNASTLQMSLNMIINLRISS